MTPSAPSRPRLPRLGVLRHRNFALFWLASLISNSGSWMQNVAQGYLVYDLTHSPLYLGVVAFSRAIPLLVLPLVGGVVADRVPRLKLLKVTQTASLVLALIFGLLVSTHIIQVWQIIVLSFLSGAISSFDQPTQQALLPDLVPPEDLAGGIALYSSSWQGAALFGPTLAGVTIAAISLSGAFYANAVSYLAVVIALFSLRGVPERSRGGKRSGLFEDLREGLRYVRTTPLVRTLLMIAAMTSIFGRPYQQMLPVFALGILHIGASGLGFMTSAPGAGALLGAVLVASGSGIRYKGRLLFAALFVFCAVVVLLAFSRVFALSLVALFAAGLTNITFGTMLSTMLQLEVPPGMRGRVMSLMTVTQQGFNPFGALLVGAIATSIGTPAAVTLGALVLAFAALVAAVGAPSVRRFSAPIAQTAAGS